MPLMHMPSGQDACEAVASACGRLAPPHRLGWGLLLAWVFCVFYTDALGPLTGAGTSDAGLGALLFYTAFPLAVAAATLAAVVAAEKRLGPVSSHATSFVAAPIICALGTPLLFAPEPEGIPCALLFGTGAVLTGTGSGVIWVLWGQRYCALDRDEAELLAPASSVMAALVVTLVAHIPGWFGVAVVTSLPLASGVCLILARQRETSCARRGGGDYDRDALVAAHACAAQAPLEAMRALGRTAFGLFTCCVATGVIGCLTPVGSSAIGLDATMAVSVVLTLAACSGASARAHGISAANLFRWACPLLVVALGLPFWLPGTVGQSAAHGLTIAARLLFCTFTQMYFSLVAGTGRVTPTQAFGTGWIAVHLGDLVGVGGVTVAGACGLAEELTGALALAFAAVVCLVCMAAMGRADEGVLGRRSDQGEATESEKAPAAQASPTTAGATVAAASRIDALSETHDLTPREREVLALLARGRSVPYIRDELSISKDTASTHVKHIYAKLGVHSRQELLDLLS